MSFVNADWSPDRSTVVSYANEKYSSGLFTVGAAGGPLTKIRDSQTGYVAYSPNGRMLAVVHCSENVPAHCAGGNGPILVMNADGTGLRTVCCDPNSASPVSVYPSRPSWTPDGARIVFMGIANDTTTTVNQQQAPTRPWSVNVDGTGLAPIPGLDGTSDAVLSPDGTRLGFVKAQCGTTGCGDTEIYLANPDGTGSHAITHEAGGHGSPVWSPDGKRLAFAGANGLSVIDSDGSNLSNVPGVAGAVPLAWG